MLMADEDSFAGSAHAVDIIVLFEAFEAREYGWVFFWLGFLGAEGIVGKGVKANCFRLVAVERFGEDGRVGGLKSCSSYG